MNEDLPTSKPAVKIEGKKTPDYPREFFELQIQFAQKIVSILNIPISQALLEYTSLYRRFNLGREPDVNNPLWQEFIANIKDKDIYNQVYDFYLKRKDIHLEKVKKKRFGCFDCEYQLEEECVYVHFGNREETGSPFDDANLAKRLEELKNMFEYIKNNYPEARVVRGNSWLYNLPKYKRFFPPEYTRDPKPTNRRFSSLSGWGQFIDQDMKIKPETLSIFQKKLVQAKSLDQVLDSLPLRTFQVETKIEDFYNFYGIK